jgi:hypothetical protein
MRCVPEAGNREVLICACSADYTTRGLAGMARFIYISQLLEHVAQMELSTCKVVVVLF